MLNKVFYNDCEVVPCQTPLSKKFIDLTGEKFKRLTIICYAGMAQESSKKRASWFCKCDCGNIVRLTGHCLKSGNTGSCGCYAIANAKKINWKHGGSSKLDRSPLYFTWKGMMGRCYSKTNKRFNYYGERGITVCDRWKKFENFLEDMKEKPSIRHSLDRIDVNGNYEPSNCRWATQKEQCNNKTNNVVISFDGQSLTVSEWAEKLNMKKITLWQRLFKAKMSVEDSLTKPVTRGGGRQKKK